MNSVVLFLLVSAACLTVGRVYRPSLRRFELRVVKDVSIERGSGNYNYLAFLLVGRHIYYPNKRSLLQFANPPRSCRSVLYARLFLYFVYAHKPSFVSTSQAPMSPRTIVAHRVLKFWKESQATSTRRFNGARWSQELLSLGTDANTCPTSEGVTIDPRLSRRWYSLDVTSAVRAWKRGYPNYGLLIRATNEYQLGRDFRFASNANRNRRTHAYIQVTCSS